MIKKIYKISNIKGMRLDKVSRILFNFTREKIKRFIKNRGLRLDGFPIKQNIKINEHQCICLIHKHIFYFAEQVVEPEYFSLYKNYEDNKILIVNKRQGLVVHPSKGNIKGTLLNELLSYNKTAFIKIPRAGLVHRIDKETSGLLIIAKKIVTYTKLKQKIQDKSIIREYDAIVIGQIDVGGYIKAQIGRHLINRKRNKIVNKDGKLAITYYRVIEKLYSHTYIRCWLETGRTHQIRVHMESIKHAVIGDELYLKNKRFPTIKIRQALHAHCLFLQHPSKTIIIKTLAKKTKDITILLTVLRQNQIYTISHN